MKNFQLGRKLILWSTLISFLGTIALSTSLQMKLLLPVNLLQHALSVIFFIGLGYVVFGLIIKKEFKDFEFTWTGFLLNILLIICLITILDNWYTIVTPHPLFHDKYFI